MNQQLNLDISQTVPVKCDECGGIYFEQVFNKTQPGSLIISDNVMWDGKVINKAYSNDESTIALQKYNDKLKKDSRIKTLLLPFSDGLSLSWVIYSSLLIESPRSSKSFFTLSTSSLKS